MIFDFNMSFIIVINIINTTLNYIIDEIFNQYSQKALIELNQFNEIMAPENLKKFI